jgi:hypothetical protein
VITTTQPRGKDASVMSADSNGPVYITVMQLNGHARSRELCAFSACVHYLCERFNDVRFEVLSQRRVKKR